MPELTTDRAMARRLGVDRQWLRGELESGRLPGVRAGVGYLVSPPAVLRVLVDRAGMGVGEARTEQRPLEVSDAS